MMQERCVWSPVLLAIAATGVLTGCDNSASNAQGQAPIVTQAEVVKVQPRHFALASELPGRIEPIRIAEVRARVAGIVLSRNFEEGATVKAGQVLFQIDPAPFKASLSRAKSDLARADAQLSEASAVVERYKPLVKVDAVSQQDFDAAKSALASARAARQAALADIEIARLNVGYATVTAPISGRIGRALVTEGALVGQNETTPMATIQQIDQVYVDFKQPVSEALAMQAARREGTVAPEVDQASAISLTIEGTSERRQGSLLFSDIAVDRATGQVSLRGRFANPDGVLLPGMYVRVHTPLAGDQNALLVPQRAVQRSVDGKPFVLVVGKDNVAAARFIRTGTMQGNEWHITSGLSAGDHVITNGQVKPGDKVSIKPRVDRQAKAADASTSALD